MSSAEDILEILSVLCRSSC